MRTVGLIAVAALCTLLGLLSGAAAEDALRLRGSTTVHDGFALPSKMQAEAELRLRVDLEGGGSSRGIAACIAGDADIAMASRPLRPKEKRQGLVGHTIGRDAIAVVVHENNPVQNLATAQLRALFTGEIANWKEVGGPDRPVHVVIRDGKSGTNAVFEMLAMGGLPYTENAVVANGATDVSARVAEDRDAIGYTGALLLGPGVKSVAVDNARPTSRDVLWMQYKLVRPILLVTKGEPVGTTKAYIDWALGPRGQAWVEKTFFPVRR